jgi:hypothetical protein
MQAYGIDWPEETNPLQIEFSFIKAGGYIEDSGIRFGCGLFHHYREAQRLLWPEDDFNPWSDLILRRKCQEDILVIQGSSDSGKTYSTAKYILTDYWAQPDRTLWLVSSIELRGAELRIWGKIKELFNWGRERYPWLKGNVLDSRYSIATDAVDKFGTEARALTRGIIVIPCKREDNYEGLGAFAGIKPTRNGRMGHLGDEVSLMSRSFLQAYANWFGKASFQGIMQGNITDIEDPLGVASEPAEGWDNWHDTGKTQEWRSKWYGAWVICLDGRDSPNMQGPPDAPPRFPYLVGRKKLEMVKATEGEDSDLYWMQCVGKPRPGAEKFKVITMQLCETNHAHEKVVWQGGNITDVLALDAAYGGVGGDRCVLMHLRFGPDTDGRTVIAFNPYVLVPVDYRKADPADVQIAEFVAQYAIARNIPPSHFFFDGRATLAVEVGRIWSNEVNVVDFGGPPTDRPVHEDEYIIDPQTKERRLKRCNEHYSKFVTELWFSFRYAIMGQMVRDLPRDVAEEGAKRIWRYTKGQPPKIEVETKKEMKQRTQRSPDLFDCGVAGVEGCRRLGLQIKVLRQGKAFQNQDGDWLERERSKFQKFIAKHELRY